MPAFYGDKTNSVRIEGDEYLIASLRSLPDNIGQKYLAQAITKGMKPVHAALIANTPVGPTGNLRQAVGAETRKYRSGVAFGVVGYRRAVSSDSGDQKGFHSHFMEFGTADRVARHSPFLSSYRLAKTGYTPASWNGMWPMRAKRVKGVRGMHPLGKAFAATKSQALSIILADMKSGLDKGQAEVARKGL